MAIISIWKDEFGVGHSRISFPRSSHIDINLVSYVALLYYGCLRWIQQVPLLDSQAHVQRIYESTEPLTVEILGRKS